MPFYDSAYLRICAEQYSETLGTFQSFIDRYSSEDPVQILGDFNCSLPEPNPPENWFQSFSYNKLHVPRLRFDVIYENNLVAADNLYLQAVDYTFFCLSRAMYSWIDHILCFNATYNTFQSKSGISYWMPSTWSLKDLLTAHINLLAKGHTIM